MKSERSKKLSRRAFLIGSATILGGMTLSQIIRIFARGDSLDAGPTEYLPLIIQGQGAPPSATATRTPTKTATPAATFAPEPTSTATSTLMPTPRVFTEDAPINFKYYTATMPITEANGSVTTQTHRYNLNGPLAYDENGVHSAYNSDKTKSYPLIVSLHASGYMNSEEAFAAGIVGDDRPFAWISAAIPDPHDNHSLPGYFEYSPICPPPYTADGGPSASDGGEWNSPAAKQMIVATIKDLMQRFNIDPNRIYLNGFSMGGAGVRYIAQEWYQNTHNPVAAILINAGYTPDDKMIGYVQGTPGTPPGPIVWEPENNQFPDLYRSAIWYHVGELDTMGLTIGNLDLAVCTYNMLKMQLPEGSEIAEQRSVDSGTLWKLYGHDTLVSDLLSYTLNGKTRYLLSVYLGGEHEPFMGANPDLFDWLFSQHH